MEFRVLGQLEAWRAGERLPLGSFKQRSLLALLLIDANQAIAADRIIDELWGDDVASDHHNALWVHVSKLRAVLEPDRERRAGGGVLETRPPGYAVNVGTDQLDSTRFERLVQEGRGLLDVDPGVAALVLGEALGLWRGRPYEDFTYESFAQAEILRLDELRLETVELRIDADLRRGLASELVGELQALVRQHPFRERFTAQLMLALHRSGRRAEALRSYAHLRSTLGDELGLDPLHRAPGARAPDPDVGPGAGPADAGECRRPAVGHPGLRAKGADRDERPGADVSRLSGGGGTRGQHHGRAAGACQRRRVHPPDADRSGGDGQPDPSEHPDGRGLLARSGRRLRRHTRVRRRHAGRGGGHRIAVLRCGHIGRGRRRRRAGRSARSWLCPRPGGPGVRPRGGRARLRARLRLRAGVAAGDRRPACARRGAVKLGHAGRPLSRRRPTSCRTRTRGWRRSARRTPETSSAASVSSSACSPGWAPSGAPDGSSPSWGRAAVASRAW